jgi:hypothetical protein
MVSFPPVHIGGHIARTRYVASVVKVVGFSCYVPFRLLGVHVNGRAEAASVQRIVSLAHFERLTAASSFFESCLTKNSDPF